MNISRKYTATAKKELGVVVREDLVKRGLQATYTTMVPGGWLTRLAVSNVFTNLVLCCFWNAAAMGPGRRNLLSELIAIDRAKAKVDRRGTSLDILVLNVR